MTLCLIYKVKPQVCILKEMSRHISINRKTSNAKYFLSLWYNFHNNFCLKKFSLASESHFSRFVKFFKLLSDRWFLHNDWQQLSVSLKLSPPSCVQWQHQQKTQIHFPNDSELEFPGNSCTSSTKQSWRRGCPKDEWPEVGGGRVLLRDTSWMCWNQKYWVECEMWGRGGTGSGMCF